MELRQGLRMSWQSIRGHALRSTLTTLGVVIGVAAVITFVTLGASLQAAVIGEVSGDQPPNVNVWAGPEESVDSGQGGPGFGARPVFTEHDLDAIRDLEGVDAVVPYATVRTTALGFRGDTVATDGIVATSPRYFDDVALSEGRLFDPGAREAVLNPAATTQFETNATVGDDLAITLPDGSRSNVTVVGVLNSSQSTGPFEGFAVGPRVYVPTEPFYTTTVESPSRGTDQRVYDRLTVIAESHDALDATQDRIEAYLEEESDAADLLPGGFTFALQTNQQLLQQIQTILNQFTGFITGVAVISLVVGSIGIANIMLVSVTERTKEIGIMKAVGAQNRDVLQLFLTEAAIIGVVGAVFGTALGVGGGYVATSFIDLPLSFPLEWFPIAVGVGVLVGLLAGFYPAWNAARTDPIDALRYE